MKRLVPAALFLCAALSGSPLAAAPGRPHNIIIFVADGLRYGSVEPGNMPVMSRLKAEGVDFTNSHSLYPTITTVNASAIATGHYIGDTGNFGNSLWAGAPLVSRHGSPIATMEDNSVLAEMNQRFGGNYLNENSLIATARRAGFSTAIIGKLGPSRIQDSTASPDGSQTLIVDDNTGHDDGFGLPGWYMAGMKQAFVGGETPKISYPDIEQEMHLMKATTRIVLPHFAQEAKPFALLFWSRDPDITQHNTKDSVGEYDPGINGPSGLAATRNADTMLGLLLQALKDQGLDKTTDVFVTADHGFTTVAHASATSPSAHLDPDVPLADLKSGFLAVDLAASLGMKLSDPAKANAPVDFSNGGKLSTGSGALGDPAHPDALVVSNGGSDLVYLSAMTAKDTAPAKELAADMVKFLLTQDYVSGVFVNDRLGPVPGALPMSALNLIGSAKTPQPAIYVNFRSFAGTCENPLQCTVGINDTTLLTGQGSHGSLSRAETRNFMAAIGPDFKTGYADPAPISNADIAPTLAHVTGLDLPPKGKLTGRVIGEALAGGAPVTVARTVIASDPGADGVRTWLDEQAVGSTRYFDAAGFDGRTVGLATH